MAIYIVNDTENRKDGVRIVEGHSTIINLPSSDFQKSDKTKIISI